MELITKSDKQAIIEAIGSKLKIDTNKYFIKLVFDSNPDIHLNLTVKNGYKHIHIKDMGQNVLFLGIRGKTPKDAVSKAVAKDKFLKDLIK